MTVEKSFPVNPEILVETSLFVVEKLHFVQCDIFTEPHGIVHRCFSDMSANNTDGHTQIPLQQAVCPTSPHTLAAI